MKRGVVIALAVLAVMLLLLQLAGPGRPVQDECMASPSWEETDRINGLIQNHLPPRLRDAGLDVRYAADREYIVKVLEEPDWIRYEPAQEVPPDAGTVLTPGMKLQITWNPPGQPPSGTFEVLPGNPPTGVYTPEGPSSGDPITGFEELTEGGQIEDGRWRVYLPYSTPPEPLFKPFIEIQFYNDGLCWMRQVNPDGSSTTRYGRWTEIVPEGDDDDDD